MLWKIYSWNVNGLRAVERKNAFRPFVESHKPDVLCLQEIKIDADAKAEAKFDLPEYQEFWNHAKRPGYSGTATFVKKELEGIIYKDGVGVEDFDSEGRVQTLEFPKFYLVNAYFPNTRPDLSRLDFKGKFNDKILAHVKKLDKKKLVILTGDYNVAHEVIDIARPRENDGQAGFHPLERKWMSKFLSAGFVDTFRHLNPGKVQYSWWSQRFGARTRNVGWRIDYFVVSKRLASKVKSANIYDQIMGSDHAPVSLEIEI